MNNTVQEPSLCHRKLTALTLSRRESGVLIFLSIVNAVCACPTFLANLLVLLAIWLKPALRCNSINLLGVLAVLDLLVGVLVQPLFVAYSAYVIRHGVESCFEHVAFFLLVLFIGCCSATCYIAVALDRYAAVVFPYRYETLPIFPVFLAAILLSCSFWAFYICCRLYGVGRSAFATLLRVSSVVFIATIVTAYVKMVLISKKHEAAIAAQVQAPAEKRNAYKKNKALKTAIHVVGAFLVCCLPLIVCQGYFSLLKAPRNERFVPKMAAVTLTSGNSLLNPIIYWWRVPHMRRAILQLLSGIKMWDSIEPAIAEQHPEH